MRSRHAEGIYVDGLVDGLADGLADGLVDGRLREEAVGSLKLKGELRSKHAEGIYIGGLVVRRLREEAVDS